MLNLLEEGLDVTVGVMVCKACVLNSLGFYLPALYI